MPRNKSDLIWEGEDYCSRSVALYVQERDHIHKEHSNMGFNFTAIYDTVEHPDYVYRSKSHENREVFTKSTRLLTYFPVSTRVIVEYNKEDDITGHVVTAYPCEREGKHDERLYTAE